MAVWYCNVGGRAYTRARAARREACKMFVSFQQLTLVSRIMDLCRRIMDVGAKQNQDVVQVHEFV